jgi:hypothetical protein
VQDPELAVVDCHGDDLAAVGVADLEFDAGNHEQGLAGDHSADMGGGDWLSGRAACHRGAVQRPVSGPLIDCGTVY